MSKKLDALPEGWALATLGEVCEPSQYGYTTKAGPTGNHKFLRTTDITKDELNWENVPHCELADEDAKKYVLSDGDIVISRAGSIGYSSLIRNPPKSVFASYLIRFRPLLNNQYLNYFLATPDYWQAISDGSSGIAVQNVNAKTLSAIEVPIAPEAEQQRIVDQLDETLSDLDNGVAELKAAQIKLTQYRQSLLKSAVEGTLTEEWRNQNQSKITETGEQLLDRILKERREQWEQSKLAEFKEKGKKPQKDWQKKYPEPVQPDVSGLPELPEGWVWASLGQCFNVEVGATPSRKQPSYWNGSVPWVSSGEVQFGRVRDTKEKITEEGLQNSSTQINPKGSVLLGMIGEGKTRGQAAILDLDAANNQNCAAIWVPLSGISSEYVFYWLWSRYDETRRGSSGNNQPALNKSLVEKMPIPISSLEEMSFIGEQLNDSFQQSIKKGYELEKTELQLQAQRKNILNDAFSGKLVPQDPNDESASVLLEKIKTERLAQAKLPKPKRIKKKKLAWIS